MTRRTTRLVVAAVALVALGAVVATWALARHLAEPTVVPDPYQEGLQYGRADAPARPAGEGPPQGPALPGQPREPPPPPPCDITHAPCARVLKGGVSVVMQVAPSPPRALTKLTFVAGVTYGGLPVGGAVLDLDLRMPGMEMGPNRVHLWSDKLGRYVGEGTVVRCPSGKKRWEAELTIAPDHPGAAAQPLKATFAFDVAG